MTGVMWSRKPESGDKDDIHLWVRDGSGWRPVCSTRKYTEEEKQDNSILISNAKGQKTILRVTQKESFTQANSGYCPECIENHHKNNGNWEVPQ